MRVSDGKLVMPSSENGYETYLYREWPDRARIVFPADLRMRLRRIHNSK